MQSHKFISNTHNLQNLVLDTHKTFGNANVSASNQAVNKLKCPK